MESRRTRKFELVRNLLKLGFDTEAVRTLFRVIDGMMILPDELENLFNEDVNRLEEPRMPLLSKMEEWAMERGELKGIQEGLETVLHLKFGEDGLSLMDEVCAIKGSGLLRSLMKKIADTATLEEARELVRQSK